MICLRLQKNLLTRSKGESELEDKFQETCIHGCYFVDMDEECNIEEEYCKREVKFIRERLITELKQKIENLQTEIYNEDYQSGFNSCKFLMSKLLDSKKL